MQVSAIKSLKIDSNALLFQRKVAVFFDFTSL